MDKEASFETSPPTRNVLISGAYRGIGLEVARAFASAGYDVIMLDRDSRISEAAQSVSTEFKCRVTPLCCDVTDAGGLVESLRNFRRVDVLVHNAGIQPITPIDDHSANVDHTIRAVLDVNVIGSFNIVRKCLPLLPDSGCIIFTASIWGKIGAPGYSAYSASKHAVIGIMRSLAPELGGRGISVNAICPGLVETPGVLKELAGEAAYTRTTSDELIREAVQQQAIKTLLQPKDVAALYIFLASEAGRSITGQAITVDRGGISI